MGIKAHISREIRVYSLPRSGQHAILYWLMGQFDMQNVVYLNNVGLRGKRYGTDNSKNRELLENKNAYIELYLMSFEGGDSNFYDKESVVFSSCSVMKKIIILRDPFNFLASKIKIGEKKLEEQILKYISLSETKGDYVILYNSWFSNEKYRRRILQYLNIPRKTDGSFTSVPPNGHGSSFDKRSFDGRGNEMEVLERYKHFLRHKPYLKLLKKYPELIEISKTHFDFYPDDLKNKIKNS